MFASRDFKERWFRLRNGLLSYFEDEAFSKPLGFIDLRAVGQLRVVPFVDADSIKSLYEFVLVTADRDWALAATSASERELWLAALRDHCPLLSHACTTPEVDTKSGDRASAASSAPAHIASIPHPARAAPLPQRPAQPRSHGEAWAPVPLVARPLDILVVVLNCFFTFSCLFIELPYCQRDPNPLIPPADGLAWPFMMQEMHQFASKNNPLFLHRPVWMRFATCISAVCFAPCYVMIAITFWRGIDVARLPILCFLGAKVYALVFYHTMEFSGSSMPPPNPLAYWGAEAPYLLGIVLTFHRMRIERPFSFRCKSKCD